MIKLAFKLIAAFWILSPALFLILRWVGVYNVHGKNTLIFLGLMLMSTITIFLTYKTWEK